jgi:NTE family protein
MKFGLVLGGGGLVGMGYHAGALKALEEWGVDLNAADLIVGTSAGSIMGSYLRCGWSASDFFEYAHGQHPQAEKTVEAQQDEVRRLFTPLWHGRSERVRRTVGSLFAAAASRGYWAVAGERMPSAWLRRTFPSGMYSTDETRERLRRDLPQEWPSKSLFVCTADLYSGKRVAFGSPGAREAPLYDAVLASTAIPGVFPPVRIGERHYVDGGALSATSLDLATEAGCKSILCIAPLGYRRDPQLSPADLRLLTPVLLRALFARTLRREVLEARSKGVQVFVIRPWLSELKAHGTNSMRHFDRAALVAAAREGTLRLLEENSEHPALEAALKSRPSSPSKERAG